MFLSKVSLLLTLASLCLSFFGPSISGQIQRKSHIPYTIELRALDYFDDGRIVEHTEKLVMSQPTETGAQ